MFKRRTIIESRGVKRVLIECKKCGKVHEADFDCQAVNNNPGVDKNKAAADASIKNAKG